MHAAAPPLFSKENALRAGEFAAKTFPNPVAALGQGAVEYWRGKDTDTAALYSGAQQMTLGNLPDNAFELARGWLHSTFGGGRSQEEQARHDEQYTAQLEAQHPISTWGGRVLGLFGLVAGAEGLTAAAVTKVPQITSTLGGKIAWGALLGAGQGALSGFSDSRDWNERVQDAKHGAMLGAFLGGAGGAIGGAIDKASAAKTAGHHAAEHFGLSAEEPLSEQLPALSRARQSIVPTSDMSMADVSRAVKDQGILQQAGSKDAVLSASGLTSISADLLHMVKADTNGTLDLGRHMDFLSPAAQRSWKLIEELGQTATKAPNGQLTLADIAATARQINASFERGGSDYNAIRTAFNKYVDNALQANAFSGGADAARAYGEYKRVYGLGAQLSPDSALGKIMDFHHGPKQIASWVGTAAQAGEMKAGVALLDQIKAIVGDASPEWAALRNTFWNSVTANNVGTGPGLSKVINNLTQTPIAKTLYTPEQLHNMQVLAQGLGAVPKGAHAAKGHAAEGLGFGLGAFEGLKHGWEHGEGEEWSNRIWDAIKGGVIGGVAGAGAMHARSLLPLAGRVGTSPAAATTAKYIVPFSSMSAWPSVRKSPYYPHNDGGSVDRALAIARRARRD
jgi:hypothetical protein